MPLGLSPSTVQDSSDHCAVQAVYWKQIEFGCAPKSALNLATIVYLQRHPTVPVEIARARVDDILDDYSRNPWKAR